MLIFYTERSLHSWSIITFWSSYIRINDMTQIYWKLVELSSPLSPLLLASHLQLFFLFLFLCFNLYCELFPSRPDAKKAVVVDEETDDVAYKLEEGEGEAGKLDDERGKGVDYDHDLHDDPGLHELRLALPHPMEKRGGEGNVNDRKGENQAQLSSQTWGFDFFHMIYK